MKPEGPSRERMLALLEANHVFPGPFHFSIVAHNRAEVTAAVRATLEAELPAAMPDAQWIEKHSAHGKYVSHRVQVICDSADQVVLVFERLFAVEGVLSVL